MKMKCIPEWEFLSFVLRANHSVHHFIVLVHEIQGIYANFNTVNSTRTHVSILKMHRKLSHAENNSYEFRSKINKKYKIFTEISKVVHSFRIQIHIRCLECCTMNKVENRIASIHKSQRNRN